MHPILFEWGSFVLPAYGVLYLAAFLSAMVVGCRLIARRTGVPFPTVFDIAFKFVIAGEVGARVTFVIVEWRRFADGSIGFMQFLTGGRVVLGGVLTASVVAVWLFRRHNLPPLMCLDAGLTSTPLGMAVGRLGCFLGGCCYGRPTDAAWGVTFTHPVAERLNGTTLGVPLHPTQLVQAASDFVLFVLLYRFFPHRKFDGHTSALFLAGAGASRFAIEFLRGDRRGGAFGLATSQWIAIAMIALGVLWLVIGLRRVRRKASPTHGAVADAEAVASPGR